MNKHKHVFKLRLGSEGPADITPTNIYLNSNKELTEVIVCRFLAEQRTFPKSYVDKLMQYAILLSDTTVLWQAAPHTVPKPNAESNYRITIDLRPLTLQQEHKQGQCRAWERI